MHVFTKQNLQGIGLSSSLVLLLIFTAFPMTAQAQHSPEAAAKMAQNPELSRAYRLAKGNNGVKLTADDGSMNDSFGYSVAIDGDYAIVGAYQDDEFKGGAYVFMREGDAWIQQQKLVPAFAQSNGETGAPGVGGDQTGYSVSLDGDYALLGATGYTTLGANDEFEYFRGAVFVFKREGDTWVEKATLFASDGEADDQFGNEVSISGEYAVIGSRSDKNKAYVFKRAADETWSEVQQITATDVADGDDFGEAVSINDDYLLVGADGDDENKGAAYVFQRVGEVWNEAATLTAMDGAGEDYFGNSVSIHGDYALVGARGDEAFTGAAYVFKRNGDAWSQVEKLTADDGLASDQFGLDVSISDEQLVVGASKANALGGAAYVFKKDESTWDQQPVLTTIEGGEFGFAVATDESTTIVGAWAANDLQGNVYVFETEESFDPGAFIDIFASGNTLDIPLGLTFGPADGHLYVASFLTDAILRYDGSTGEFIDVFVPTASGMLDAPTGLRFGPDNHLYVSSRDTDQVLRYDGQTGAFVDVFAENMNLDAPEELLFGEDGHLYVASRDSDKILRFNGATGEFVDVFAEDENLQGPVGMAWGPDGNLYASSHIGVNQVVRFDGTTGEFMDVFTKNGGLSAPNFIVFGPTGDLFVGNGAFTDQVVRFDGETGEFKDLFIRDTAFFSSLKCSIKIIFLKIGDRMDKKIINLTGTTL